MKNLKCEWKVQDSPKFNKDSLIGLINSLHDSWNVALIQAVLL